MEFYYHPNGILLPPISTNNLDYKPFLAYCNQVINQVINQVYLSRRKITPKKVEFSTFSAYFLFFIAISHYIYR